MTDKITLVIPVFNDESHIEQCLMSALGQSLPACEVIVIDDGSTDRSGAIALEFQDRYPTMKVIRHERNLAFLWQRATISRFWTATTGSTAGILRNWPLGSGREPILYAAIITGCTATGRFFSRRKFLRAYIRGNE